jgi:hypothetical protein
LLDTIAKKLNELERSARDTHSGGLERRDFFGRCAGRTGE